MSTRQHILEILETRSTITADELANILHMTPANARHHLSRLERDGRVIAIGARPPRGRGRPPRLFALPQRGAGTERLAGHLLDQILGILPHNQQAEFLRALALRLGGETDSGRHITQRLGGAVSRLNDLEYQARWEAHSITPRIILGNCPYAAIVNDHPELCKMDAHLLENLVNQAVTQTAKLQRTPQGLPVCVFVLKKS